MYCRRSSPRREVIQQLASNSVRTPGRPNPANQPAVWLPMEVDDLQKNRGGMSASYVSTEMLQRQCIATTTTMTVFRPFAMQPPGPGVSSRRRRIAPDSFYRHIIKLFKEPSFCSHLRIGVCPAVAVAAVQSGFIFFLLWQLFLGFTK